MASFLDTLLAKGATSVHLLSETSGQHLDRTANAHNSTTVSVTGQGTVSPDSGWAGVGNGDDFVAASTNYVSVPDSTAYFPGADESFSLLAVVKADIIDTTYRRVMSHEVGTPHGWTLTVQDQSGTNHPDDGFRFERMAGLASPNTRFVSSGASATIGVMPATGTTYMVSCVAEKTATNVGTLRMYLGSTLVAEKTGQVFDSMSDPGAPMTLGRRNWDVSRYFDGAIFAAAYFPLALTATDVGDIYAARNTVASTDPALNTNLTVTVGNRFRLRGEIQETAGVALTTGFKIRVSKNSGAYSDVATGSGDVRIVDSPNFANGAATTDILPSGTGTFVAGEGLDTSGTSGAIPLPSGGHSEVEVSMILFSGTPGDTFDFRFVRSAGTVFEANTFTPRIVAA